MNRITSQRHLHYLVWAFFFMGVSVSLAQTDNNQTSGVLQRAIENKSYTLQVQSVSPMKGGTRQLNPGYILTVKGDTLIANLPYFGRVYQAALGADGGFNFTSYEFDYQVKPGKKDGWNVSIKTKDQPSQRKFNLTITKSGSASLAVLSSDRESISYYGVLEPGKK